MEVVLSEEHLTWFADQGTSTIRKHIKLDESNPSKIEHHLLDLIEWKSSRKGKIKTVKVYLSLAKH